MESRIKLTVAYLGDGFCGWQRQAGKPTVQDEIARALARMTGVPTGVVGAGRTDAGVHAAAQAAHADLPARIEAAAVVSALNASLDPRIRVRSAVAVPETFHARHDARAKLYRYRISWRPPRLPWHGLRTATVAAPIDPAAVRRALESVTGTNDMASFSVPQPGSTVRTLHRAWLEDRRAGAVFSFVGDGFLRYQVRRLVGALLEVGFGRLSTAGFEELVDRPRPGSPIRTAPARGLTLERVFYRRSPLLDPRGRAANETEAM
jgi:tRNA pseudouridine38-40 synthase